MKKGFTLVEIMVAISIFALVMAISMGAIIGIFSANRKSSSIKVAMDNLNSAVETMSREMRFGTQYHCEADGPTSDLSQPQNCAAGGKYVSFLSSDGHRIAYQLSGTTLMKMIDTTAMVPIPVTAPQVTINNLSFTVRGTGDEGLGVERQPTIFIKASGTAGQGDNATSFSLQTLVSQRVPDISGVVGSTGGTSGTTCTDTGLLGCWLFDGSGSTAADASGNSLTMTLNGGASQSSSGVSGQALGVDGANGSNGSVSGGGLGASSVTVSAWFKVNNLTSESTYSNGANTNTGAVIFSTRDNDGDVSPTLLVSPMQGNGSLGSPRVEFVCDTAGLAMGARGSTDIQPGQWYHVVGVYEKGGGNYAGTWSVYLNPSGSTPSADSNNFDLSLGTCPGTFSGSTWYAGDDPQWPGSSSILIDNLRVYNRALPPSEVGTLP